MGGVLDSNRRHGSPSSAGTTSPTCSSSISVSPRARTRTPIQAYAPRMTHRPIRLPLPQDSFFINLKFTGTVRPVPPPPITNIHSRLHPLQHWHTTHPKASPSVAGPTWSFPVCTRRASAQIRHPAAPARIRPRESTTRPSSPA
ncbi:hypothetical protein EVG20_g8253 [Dentipellis fragilis]|uniref:Uncharacterized protein n=1 Tax=Dentipellis fragilis TaxID=205917 RepID=A0A4Y9Y6N1_9AGAM|nr:hypothetical protein EVG20_g8253 [Dentipellis fragilis]